MNHSPTSGNGESSSIGNAQKRRIRRLVTEHEHMERIARSSESSSVQRKYAHRRVGTLSQRIASRMKDIGWGNSAEEENAEKKSSSNGTHQPTQRVLPHIAKRKLLGGLNGITAQEAGESKLIPSDVIMRVEESETPDATEGYGRTMDELDWE